MMRTEELTTILSEYPAKLYDKEGTVLNLKSFIESLRLRLSSIELQTDAEILEDMKKPEWGDRLSNEKKRLVERESRLREHAEYSDLKASLNENELLLRDTTRSLAFDERVWQSAKAMAYLLSAR